jgi:hypothetical protein
VNQKPSGKLEVEEVKVHKVPVEQDGMIHQESRYNFEDKDAEETR